MSVELLARLEEFPTNSISPTRNPSSLPLVATLKIQPSLSIPSHFDRLEDPLILEAPKQECGSCWAYAGAGMLNDRMNLITKEFRVFSIHHLLACNTISTYFNPDIYKNELVGHTLQELLESKKYQCFGDYLISALYFLFFMGITTKTCGEDKNRVAEIYNPYYLGLLHEYESCENNYSGTRDLCAYTTFLDGVAYGRPMQKFTGLWPYNYPVENRVQSIQQDIMLHGPVATTIDAFTDFWLFDPSTTIYSKSPDSTFISGHAVLIVGWGSDFWWIKNSWGKSWGINGYFKIKKGVDECMVETNALGIRPIPPGTYALTLEQQIKDEFDIHPQEYTKMIELYQIFRKSNDLSENSSLSFPASLKTISPTVCWRAYCNTGFDTRDQNGYSEVWLPSFPGIQTTKDEDYTNSFSQPFPWWLTIISFSLMVVLILLGVFVLLRPKQSTKPKAS